VDTFELLPSLAEGDLGETTVAELVAAVLRVAGERHPGHRDARNRRDRAFFRSGDMCGTASFTGFRTLAHVLLATDRIDALQIESTQQAAAKAEKRHGELLVEQGLLTAEELRAALAAQHRENLHVLLGLAEGKYEWRGWEPPPAWAREVTVDPVSCMVDALQTDALRGRRVACCAGWPARRGCPPTGRRCRRGRSRCPRRRAAALLATPREVDEFVSASKLPAPRAEALLVSLLLCGCAEPAGQRGAAEPVPQEAEAIGLTPVEPADSGRAADAGRTLSDVEQRLDAAAAGDGDEPLELDRDEAATSAHGSCASACCSRPAEPGYRPAGARRGAGRRAAAGRLAAGRVRGSRHPRIRGRGGAARARARYPERVCALGIPTPRRGADQDRLPHGGEAVPPRSRVLVAGWSASCRTFRRCSAR